MPVPVLRRDDAPRADVQPRLLAHLLLGIAAHRLQHVAPAAGQRPQAVLLLHEQDFSVAEHRGAGVDLRGLVAGLIAEQPPDRVRRQLGAVGEHLGGDVADALEALNIVDVAAVEQPRLCQRLKLYRPVQPFFVGHGWCLLCVVGGRLAHLLGELAACGRLRGRRGGESAIREKRGQGKGPSVIPPKGTRRQINES